MKLRLHKPVKFKKSMKIGPTKINDFTVCRRRLLQKTDEKYDHVPGFLLLRRLEPRGDSR